MRRLTSVECTGRAKIPIVVHRRNSILKHHLLLMRHAKSDWSGPSVSDHDRPLNARGRRDSPAMARWILDQGLRPDLILCSSATRTRETAMLLNGHWPRAAEVSIQPDLYLSSPETILGIIRSECVLAEPGKSCGTVLVLAHNPGISGAVSRLLGGSASLATAEIFAFLCDVPDWFAKLDAGNAALMAQMKPKSLDPMETDP